MQKWLLIFPLEQDSISFIRRTSPRVLLHSYVGTIASCGRPVIAHPVCFYAPNVSHLVVMTGHLARPSLGSVAMSVQKWQATPEGPLKLC